MSKACSSKWMIIISVSSGSGNVRVKNADDGVNGVSAPATFDYTSQVGADQELAARRKHWGASHLI